MNSINVDPEEVGLHDTDSSELSAPTTSNSMLPQLEATNAEKAQNEEERRRRAARKEKRKAREKKKKEQQRFEEKKARKDDNKGKGKKNDDNKYIVVSFNYSSMSMTNHDHKSFINVPTGKLPHFDGTNFSKWKHLMGAYLISLHLTFGRLFAMDLSHRLIPRTQH